jgi:small conductance mechanosensitive channel
MEKENSTPIPKVESPFKMSNTFQKENWVQRSMHIAIGIVVLIIAHVLGTVLKGSIYRWGKERSSDKQKDIEDRKTPLPFVVIGQFAYYSIIIISLMMVLKFIGIETTGILALIGAAGFAIGLALQGTLSDMASGVLLAGLQVFTVGEIIEIDGTRGRVKDFTLFHTILENDANDTIMIPNRKIQEGLLINHTRQKVKYITVATKVSNKNTDYDAIIDVIKTAAATAPEVAAGEEVSAYVSDMAGGGTTIEAFVPVNSSEYIGAQGSVATAIRKALVKNNINLIDCGKST